MPSSIPAPVESSVLRWARESCGLSALAAARKLGLPDDRVEAWEAGRAVPTIAQLRKAAEVYKRSLAVFFLSEPPEGFDTLRDFRRLDGTQAGHWSPELHEEFRRAHTQRDFALELAETEERELPVAWRIPVSADDNDAEIAARIRAALIDVGPLPIPPNSLSPYEHLNAWVSAIEASGMLVLATRGGKVSVDEMRGMSLYFDVLPVIVLNGGDYPRPRLFSLLHEFVHLVLHTEGLCDVVADDRPRTANRTLEARCNAVAAAVLMPAADVRARPDVIARRDIPASWDYDTLRPVAAQFGVSAEAFLRRLSALGLVPVDLYRQRRAEFIAAHEEEADRARTGGGDWYRNTVRDLGKAYVRAVTDAHRRRVIDSNTAAIYLDAKVSQIPRLAESAELRNVV
ncbi:XRE family transcriptional regulator [Mycobacterium avium]|uniref:XRE family transcriptional regulator n=1 Tax=Mycobacterium avium TaxID=1764 RepID=UPI00067CBD34|nr:XRE family transcriptional regulator [Mycobacterium avium]AYJ05172.1 ImmA/IrrE family metallo-endopeptidase [Mycobacterium avium]MDV3266849.1 XRE family transcriptional regulator [Mycobacterium avium]QGW32293.1 Helix-turn-helix protein [Mycobacterium avium subsp. avium]UEA21992.1 XRE family transcriptional regulator [Mycobacterium avium subsp. avium]UGU13686.1 XRE family transcriptional regulator [Mycobacterium avium subsp. avium]